GRTTVIVTRQPEYRVPGAMVAHTLTDAIALSANDDEILVIGGAELFREALPSADRLYLTVVDATPEGDTYMPEIDMSAWRLISTEDHAVDDKHAYAYRLSVYDRVDARRA